MATELQITSWRNVLDLLDGIKDTLETVNNQAKLLLAASATKAANYPYTVAPITVARANADPSLVGFAVEKLGKIGGAIEWYELVKRRVLNGALPPAFVVQAYKKGTGDPTPIGSMMLWVGKPAMTPGITLKLKLRAPDPIGPWINGQYARLNYMVNDIVRDAGNLQLELTRVRVPMPEQFRKWLVDIRDTAVAVSSTGDYAQRTINLYRLWELTAYKGQLVSDVASIRKFVDTEVAKIEAGAAAPAPVQTTATAPAPAPASVQTLIPAPATEPVYTTMPVSTSVSLPKPEANEAVMKAMQLYFEWLKKTHPDFYAAVYEQANSGQLGATETTAAEKPWYEQVGEFIKDLAPVYLATEQQRQLNELNLARAKNGQPPIDASQAAGVTAQVGLSKSTQNTILLGAGLLAAGVAASQLGHPRRRRA